jgi:hypothetical protein
MSDTPMVANKLLAGMAAVAAFMAVAAWWQPGRSVDREHDAPHRPSLHAAPPTDTVALNAAPPRVLPQTLAGEILAAGRPSVVIFLKADCECSKGFARHAQALAPHLASSAAMTAIIAGTADEREAFVTETGLTLPTITDPGSALAEAWGIGKAGCFALVRPDRSVEAVWSGFSRQGFEDVARRLASAPLPHDLLAELPGTPLAGCPLLADRDSPRIDSISSGLVPATP